MSEAPDRPSSVLVAVSDAERAERVRAVIDALGMRAQVAASMAEAEGAAAPGRFDVAIVDGRLEAEGAAGLLRSVDPPDYFKLLQKGDRILDNVVNITSGLDELLSSMGREGATREVAGTLKSLRRVLAEVEGGRGLLHNLIYEDRSRKLLDDLAEASASLKRLVASIERGNGLLHAMIYDKEQRITEKLSRTLSSLEESAVSIRRTSEAIESLTTRVKSEEGLLHALLFDPKGREVVQDLKEVTGDLKRVADKLAQGEGTLGALIEDPALYEDLASLLRGANRSVILRSLIRSSVRKGEERR